VPVCADWGVAALWTVYQRGRQEWSVFVLAYHPATWGAAAPDKYGHGDRHEQDPVSPTALLLYPLSSGHALYRTASNAMLRRMRSGTRPESEARPLPRGRHHTRVAVAATAGYWRPMRRAPCRPTVTAASPPIPQYPATRRRTWGSASSAYSFIGTQNRSMKRVGSLRQQRAERAGGQPLDSGISGTYESHGRTPLANRAVAQPVALEGSAHGLSKRSRHETLPAPTFDSVGPLCLV